MRAAHGAGIGLLLVVGGLALALALRTEAWFAWTGDRSYEAAVIAAGRVLVLGVPQYVGLAAALVGLVMLAAAGGYELARRRLRD
ncbi:hypothetical protein [Georgenia daeguensis]|uniref:hypothetical protein n=1 Tax=Georgenia daeguensis TaxID=908355 RepID=UPI0031EAAACC